MQRYILGRNTKGLEKLKIDKKDGLYPQNNIYPSNEIYPKEATYTWITYKFKSYKKNVTEDKTIIKDLNMYYVQSQKIDCTGDINLLIKYERAD